MRLALLFCAAAFAVTALRTAVGKIEPCLWLWKHAAAPTILAECSELPITTIRLTSPEYVRPYVKRQKNDAADAVAIAEAATRPTMRFVPVKSEAQSDIQALHRARSRLVVWWRSEQRCSTICALFCLSAEALWRRGGASWRMRFQSSPIRTMSSVAAHAGSDRTLMRRVAQP